MSRFTLDHLHIRSADPDTAAKFYVDALDAKIVSRAPMEDRIRVVLDLGGLSLFLETVPASTPTPPPPPFRGIEHIGLAVADIDAVMASVMDGHGAVLVKGVTQARPGVRIAFFDSPEGVRVELIERSS
ncbi:VOC family protein [Humitalea sp. 24SJ18S-53]|uniref:VOC family protein n=1 Tax=Humitalea sp. 24SJ18S-53 TaxID=3422307 RepID=UPI003D673692